MCNLFSFGLRSIFKDFKAERLLGFTVLALKSKAIGFTEQGLVLGLVED
jgi:hypothetical protein